jgi:hypothetical protein
VNVCVYVYTSVYGYAFYFARFTREAFPTWLHLSFKCVCVCECVVTRNVCVYVCMYPPWIYLFKVLKRSLPFLASSFIQERITTHSVGILWAPLLSVRLTSLVRGWGITAINIHYSVFTTVCVSMRVCECTYAH